MIEKLIEARVVRPGSERFRLVLQEARLGRLSFDGRLWRWGLYESDDPRVIAERIKQHAGEEIIRAIAERKRVMKRIGGGNGTLKGYVDRLVMDARMVYRYTYYVGEKPLNEDGRLERWGEWAPERLQRMLEDGYAEGGYVWEVREDSEPMKIASVRWLASLV